MFNFYQILSRKAESFSPEQSTFLQNWKFPNRLKTAKVRSKDMTQAVLEYHSRGYETHRYVFSRKSNCQNLPTAYLGIDPPVIYNNNALFKQNSIHPNQNYNFYYDNPHVFPPHFYCQINKKVKKTKGLIKLEKEISSFCQSLEPTEQTDKDRQAVIDRIRTAIQTSLPNVMVEVFGSFKTGLYFPSSDIDIVIFHDLSSTPFECIRQSLIEAGVCDKSRITILSNATVPIIKLTDKQTNIKIDIAFNVENASKSVLFIQASLSEWPVMKSLLTVLKQLLKDQHLNEVYSGGVSSYSLTLLILFFLKQAQPKGSPTKHPKQQPSTLSAKSSQSSPQQQQKSSLQQHQQHQPCAVLLLKFLEFYVHSFNYHVFGISVNPCGLFFKQFISDALVIEDPLCPSNDVARGSYRFSLVQFALKEAYDKLNNCICNYNDNKLILHSIIHINKPPNNNTTSPISTISSTNTINMDNSDKSESTDAKNHSSTDSDAPSSPDTNDPFTPDDDDPNDVTIVPNTATMASSKHPMQPNHTLSLTHYGGGDDEEDDGGGDYADGVDIIGEHDEIERTKKMPKIASTRNLNNNIALNNNDDDHTSNNSPTKTASLNNNNTIQPPSKSQQLSAPSHISSLSSSSSSSSARVNCSDDDDEGLQSGSDSGYSDSKMNFRLNRNLRELHYANQQQDSGYTYNNHHLHLQQTHYQQQQLHHQQHIQQLQQQRQQQHLLQHPQQQQQQQQYYYNKKSIKPNRQNKNSRNFNNQHRHSNNTQRQQQQQQQFKQLNELIFSLIIAEKENKRMDVCKQNNDVVDSSDNKPSDTDSFVVVPNHNINNTTCYATTTITTNNNNKSNNNLYCCNYGGGNEVYCRSSSSNACRGVGGHGSNNNKNKNRRHRKFNNNNNSNTNNRNNNNNNDRNNNNNENICSNNKSYNKKGNENGNNTNTARKSESSANNKARSGTNSFNNYYYKASNKTKVG